MKKTLRDLSMLVGLALLGTLLVILWHKYGTSTSLQRTLADQMSKPSPQLAVSVPRFGGSPNRQTPDFQPLDKLPDIPVQPTDDQIVGSRIFADRLWPVDSLAGAGTLESDNAALGEFLRSTSAMTEREKFAALEEWLKNHSGSRWALALKNELMGFKFKTGWFDVARQGWDDIWQKTKDRTDLPAYHLANGVLGSLLDTNVGMSRTTKLRELVNAAAQRPLNGALEGKVFRAREMVWLLDHTASQNVMCGPLALNAIKEFKREPFVAPRLSQVPPDFQQTGLPLSEVQRYAETDYKLDMRMAKRSSPALKIPTPAVMHVKDDHFNALLQASEDGSQYFMEDRTLGYSGWVDKAAVEQSASGYFLIAANSLGNGWEPLDASAGQKIYGRDGAHGVIPTDETTDPDDPKTDDDGDPPCGMPRYTFHPMPGAIRIGDIPLRYSPPVGPSVAFHINYNDMDSAAPTSAPTWSHVGLTWSTNWVAWIEHVSGALTNGTNLRVRVPGGGTQVVKYSTTTSKFGPHDQSFAVVTRTGTYTYTREMPDGSKEVYNAPNNPTTPTRIFLSQIIDPQGNSLSLAYDSNVRLVSVTDTIGQVTTLAYTDTANIYRITRVTDPFGRFCTLTYDTGGRLTGVTDQIGLATTFTYGTNGFIATMVTPYGTSSFSNPVNISGSNRIVEATDPSGGKQRVEFNDTGNTSIASLREPPSTVMVGNAAVPFYAENTRLHFRNAWYWDKLANQVAPGDYKAARNYRFYTNSGWQVVPVIEAMKNPGEDRVWVNYPGGVGSPTSLPYYLGSNAAPEKTLRILADGTPQLRQTYTNPQGNTIKTVDPLGRTTEYSYAANGQDLTEIRQTTGGVNERQLAITYNAQHLPLTITDAAGSVTTYTYNVRGQVLTVTNALSQVTTFAYNANGFLTSVDGPLTGSSDTTSFTYDAQGRILTTTNSDAYTRTYSYDSFDRVTRIDYPDSTFEQIAYDKLDRASFRDRLGRVTTYTHNAVQQLVQVTDPLSRTVKMDWCRCGSLAALTDPMGRVTRWQRDLQGRVTAKIYADNSKVVYNYDDATGRLLRRTDEKGQHKVYDYLTDDAVRQISYPNAQIATPTVSYTYESKYPRMASMKDGIGTTLYAYQPITGSSTPGAGQLGSVDGPFQDDTITYSYDALGRAVSRAINGVASSITLDALGRTTALTDALGTFNFAYDGPTNRVLSMTRPNNVTTFYQYHDNANDRRLKQIKHQRVSDSSVISQFDYTYDSVGRILTWAQGEDGGTPDVWNVGYDAADQLTSVNVTKSGSPMTSYAYTYDPAGNRVSKNENANSTVYRFNSLNRTIDSSTSLATTKYEWDAENRMTKATTGSFVTMFRYDGGNRCVSIEKYVLGVIADSSTFIIDRDKWVEERGHNGKSVKSRHCEQGLRDEGAAISLFYAQDHLSSTRQVMDQTGAAVTQINYSPYGDFVAAGSQAVKNYTKGFTGHRFLQEHNLYLAPFRAYNASLGRWVSPDPLGEAGDINLYRYAISDPIGLVDPLGLYSSDEFLQDFVNYSAGFGDALTFGLTDWVREELGSNGVVDKCSGLYNAGETTGIVLPFLTGIGGGIKAAGSKGVGLEFSHFIPNRYGGPRSILNGNYVSTAQHALSDPYRYRFMPRAWKQANPMPNRMSQMWNRIPNTMKGAGAGAAASGAAYGNSQGGKCGCPNK